MSDDRSCNLTIESSFLRAKEAEDVIVQKAQGLGYGEEAIFALRLSLEEALTNAIRHGNGSDASRKVHIVYQVTDERIEATISDEGPGFDPATVADPTAEDKLGEPSGRGILLMRAYMDEVSFNAAGNSVHLVKVNPHGDGAERLMSSSGNLEMVVGEREGTTVVSLEGSADMSEANELSRVLEGIIEGGKKDLVLDLQRLDFICSMGLGVLIKSQSQCGGQGGSLVLVSPQPEVRRVLKTTRLDELFAIHASVEAAMARKL